MSISRPHVSATWTSFSDSTQAHSHADLSSSIVRRRRRQSPHDFQMALFASWQQNTRGDSSTHNAGSRGYLGTSARYSKTHGSNGTRCDPRSWSHIAFLTRIQVGQVRPDRTASRAVPDPQWTWLMFPHASSRGPRREPATCSPLWVLEIPMLEKKFLFRTLQMPIFYKSCRCSTLPCQVAKASNPIIRDANDHRLSHKRSNILGRSIE
ncbi:hypothetical protein C7974DRAFT_157439 [Boeremia exigua]|uniref:uncharacterized protein n=1 Tax=Boeremia exigua TaxID=749465 RepID=UPI001E8D5726|nr:uncharacterized protein C7974DRAFT_157439 [Boeremia exigua]KAH6638256.1 hypothetical protein C7974DRAFT_157439 [Boeremia exigua]